MNPEELEKLKLESDRNTGSSKTNNDEFDKNGYLVIKNLWDPKELYHPVPNVRGMIRYWGKKIDQFNYIEEEAQVKGSLARYWYPQYREIHTGIRLKMEKAIGKKLYNTYYYDRFYFPGQELTKHLDRPSCEISSTVHISTNLKTPWPVWVENLEGKGIPINLDPGDGIVYKGCERIHWREPMPTEYKNKWLRIKEKEDLYYHQIFMHYVLADGIRSHFAGDGN